MTCLIVTCARSEPDAFVNSQRAHLARHAVGAAIDGLLIVLALVRDDGALLLDGLVVVVRLGGVRLRVLVDVDRHLALAFAGDARDIGHGKVFVFADDSELEVAGLEGLDGEDGLAAERRAAERAGSLVIGQSVGILRGAVEPRRSRENLFSALAAKAVVATDDDAMLMRLGSETDRAVAGFGDLGAALLGVD